MNIFYLDSNPKKAAALHCDTHVVKMILETAQLLSTACRQWEAEGLLPAGTSDADADSGSVTPALYKTTHINHPSAVWARSSRETFDWTLCLLEALLAEYTRRYGKVHKTTGVYVRLAAILGWHWGRLPAYAAGTSAALPFPPTEPPACVDEDLKARVDDSSDGMSTVEAYREYYRRKDAAWKAAGKRPMSWR